MSDNEEREPSPLNVTPVAQLPPELRYTRDATYKHMVDMLESLVHQAQLTPFEVREASMLACIHYELRNIRPLVVYLDKRLDAATYADTLKRVDAGYARMEQIKRWMKEYPLPPER